MNPAVVPPFNDPTVEAAYAAFHPAVRDDLLALRALAFETAAGIDGVGEVTEALKWGQPSFVCETGSTFRLGEVRAKASDTPVGYAIYMLCQTSLIATFRETYGDVLHLIGNREIRFNSSENFPRDVISHCFAQALTYSKVKKITI